jgi:integrase
MPRAAREKTKYPGIYKRVIYARGGSKGRTVYDLKIKNTWLRGKHTNIEDAKRERDRLLVEAQGGGSITAGRRTVRDWIENDYLPLQRRRADDGHIRPQTLDNYRRDLNGYILPTFGEYRLSELTASDVDRFTNELAERLAGYTIDNILKPLSGAYELACKQRIVSYNPVQHAYKPPRRAKRKPPSLTLADVHKLAGAVRAAEGATDPDDRSLILTAAFTGLRPSELFGLTLDDIDPLFEDRAFYTLRAGAHQCYQGRYQEGAKTRAGNRELILPEQAVEALRTQIIESKRPNPDRLVFPSATGKPQRASNWNRRVWQPIREKAGLPHVVQYDLRRFYTSHVEARSGLARSIIEQHTGHTDERTHQTYIRPVAGTELATAEGLTRAFAPQEDG